MDHTIWQRRQKGIEQIGPMDRQKRRAVTCLDIARTFWPCDHPSAPEAPDDLLNGLNADGNRRLFDAQIAERL